MSLIDDLLELSRPDLQDLCRTQEVRVNLNADQRALASAAVEQLSPELILMWWVNRELEGAMIDLGAAISGGMKRTWHRHPSRDVSALSRVPLRPRAMHPHS